MPKTTTPTPRRRGRPPAPEPVIRVTMSLDQPTLDRLYAWQEAMGTPTLSATVREMSRFVLPKPGAAGRKKS